MGLVFPLSFGVGGHSNFLVSTGYSLRTIPELRALGPVPKTLIRGGDEPSLEQISVPRGKARPEPSASGMLLRKLN